MLPLSEPCLPRIVFKVRVAGIAATIKEGGEGSDDERRWNLSIGTDAAVAGIEATMEESGEGSDDDSSLFGRSLQFVRMNSNCRSYLLMIVSRLFLE